MPLNSIFYLFSIVIVFVATVSPVTTREVAAQPPTLSGPRFPSESSPALASPSTKIGNKGESSSALAPPMDDAWLLPEERVNIAVYERCNQSVVHISTRSIAMEAFQQVSVRKGSGSGSVLDKSGLILTNHHVIEGAREVSVSLYNGLSYTATLIGQDKETDIAVLKIEAPAEQLMPIEWGNSQSLRVGQRIYAIGNPFGLERTMSTGMISSLNRQIPSSEGRTMRSLIQIDASLNQGNSGGPLLSTRGQLIGMNTAIMSSDGDSAGVGFAIPVSTLSRIVPQLIEHGRVVRPTIGITRVYETENGLLIVSLATGGPAERAGLKGCLVAKLRNQMVYVEVDTSNADLIFSVDGTAVRSADELLTRIEDKKPGESVTLGVLRGGRSIEVNVILGHPEN